MEESIPEPQNRSTGALILFLLFALPLPLCLFVYHFVVWSIEQSAIISLSAKMLARAGLIGLAAQTVVMTIVTAALWRFTKDERFKPIYAGLFGAAIAGLPALFLKTLDPNYDQIGAIAQFLICGIGAGGVIFLRKNKITWERASLPFGLVIAGIGFAPYLLYGSFGSFSDIFFSLLASLAFGLFAAVLIESTTGNLLLDGVGIGAALALLGSAIGYDGAQLLLLVILPSFSFAIAAVMPSKFAAGAAITLLTFAALAMFDPTELTIELGDIGGIAAKTSAIVFVVGGMTGLIAVGLRRGTESTSGPRIKRAVGWAGAGVVWIFVIALFFMLGHPGNYGDRLFIILKDQADISSVAKVADRNERLGKTYKKLTEHANKTQADLRSFFEKANIEYKPYYLENAMEARGGILLELYLRTRPDVGRVLHSPRLRFAPEDEPQPGFISARDSGAEWNISMIGADKVWREFHIRGEGIVVGQSDTGVDAGHPALREQYRGLNQGDDYNWFDPWSNTSAPHDEIGHGTHTLGTILGADGIGVAPKATWIGCVNLDRNLSNPALYLDCMQLMLAPFPHDGDPFTDGDPTRAAHVMNNSWGCPALEGCDPKALLYAADNLRNAGIFVVVSTGNDGPNCETVESPLSLYDSVFSVGAIDQLGNVAEFSSRGPVVVDGSKRVKPDIVAPGVNILSSLPKGTYGAESGTSMAGPHLVGAVALIWSAQPKLIGDIKKTENLIIETAQPYTGEKSTGCFTGDTPNNAYGYGVVDVYAAVKQALGK
ncbi:MAG: S8 family serine peptidase [Anaerolineales bacterium]|nr:S8 family serine peptidase [Anaerolineales bacterium]